MTQFNRFVVPKCSDEQIIRYWVLAIKNCYVGISITKLINMIKKYASYLFKSLSQIVINDYLPLCLVELYPAIS